VLGAVVNLFGLARSDQGRSRRKFAASANFLFEPKPDTLMPGPDVEGTIMRMLKTRRGAAALLGIGMLVGVGGPTAGAGAAPAKSDQTITVTVHAPSTRTYATAFSVAANAVPSGLPVSFSSSGACSNAGDRFTMTSGTGTCLVKYDQAGDATYNPAPQVVESVTAQKADQTIFFDAGGIEDKTFGDLDFDIAGAFASSDLPVTLTATGKCRISGVTVHLTGIGSCTITATQGGDTNYNAAPPFPRTFTIAGPACAVPKVTGKTLRAAKRAITAGHCRTGKVTYAHSRKTAKGRVSSQSPRPGRRLPFNSRVNLAVSLGRP
jgi:hypothetical protein